MIIGGFYSPGVGVVDRSRGYADARGGPAGRRAQVAANIEVTGIDTERGAGPALRTTSGDVETEHGRRRLRCLGPLLAHMAGASIPDPRRAPDDRHRSGAALEDAKAAIEYPIVRDMDTNMYERQDGRGLEIGSYAHRPILHDPAEIPSIRSRALADQLPFTQDDFSSSSSRHSS